MIATDLTTLRNVRESSGVPLSAFAYTYDNMTNRLSMKDLSVTHTYEYDKLYRLTAANVPSYTYYSHAYTYDAAGNRLEDVSNWADVISDYLPGNLLHTVVSGDLTTTYEWDQAGNLLSKDEQTGAGPILETAYTFDGGDRLRQVALPSGTTATYDYDVDGRRVKSSVAGRETWFVFDGLSVVMELNADRVPSAVFVPGVSKTRLDVAEPVTEYYMLDGLGSVVQLVDEKGNLTQEYKYDPFGGLQDSAVDRFNHYRFVGLAHEDLTGLTYMNARWYDPTTGRFLSRDPLSGSMADPVSLNLYAYARNNPVSDSDPTGLSTSNPFGGNGPGFTAHTERSPRAGPYGTGDPRTPEQKAREEAAEEARKAAEKNEDSTEARHKREAAELEAKGEEVYHACIDKELPKAGWEIIGVAGGVAGGEAVAKAVAKKAIKRAIGAVVPAVAVAEALHAAWVLEQVYSKCKKEAAEFIKAHAGSQ